MIYRKAGAADIDAVEALYMRTHQAEAEGKSTTGWKRDIYPVRKTAEDAAARDDLFVMEDDGKIVATSIVNKVQVDVYAEGDWQYDVPDDEVMVLHTLAVDPDSRGKGVGPEMVRCYEKYALDNGCRYLRIDTNAINTGARKMYAGLGYKEVSIVPCTFNGIPGINLVLLEKKIG